ncbi:MAG: hypothetical protein KDB80_00855, partial [Planctomycetes bacterium]|nr:hypothetical protein [Planctomycetota bacterium]
MRFGLRFFVLASLLVAAPGASQEPWTVERVLSLETVFGPQLGDDFVVFSKAVPRPIADGPGGARIHVAVIDGLESALSGAAEPRWLIAGEDSASGVAVRPGSRTITSLETVEGKRLVHARSIEGGDPTLLADTVSVGSYAWRPDGKAFAFTSTDEMPDARKAAQDAGIKPVIVDEDWRHRSLWIWEEGVGARKLTEGTSVFEFHWSPDGTKLACACAPRNLVDDSYMFKRLHVVDVATGARELLVDNPGKLGGFDWSADGAHIAYVSAADPNDPHAGMLYSVDVDSGEVNALTRGLLGMVQSVRRMDDGFLLLESVGVRTRLRHVSVEGLDRWIFDPKSARIAIDDVVVGPSVLAFTAESRRHPAELFVMASGGKDFQRVTDTNPWLADATFGEQSVVRFRARDRLPIEGVLIKPIGYEEGKRYPLVIVVHGGPEAHNVDGWL